MTFLDYLFNFRRPVRLASIMDATSCNQDRHLTKLLERHNLFFVVVVLHFEKKVFLKQAFHLEVMTIASLKIQ